MVTLAEATTVIGRGKTLLSDMAWKSKLGKLELDWLEARILVQFVDEIEIPEQLLVICQWRKKCKAIPEHWTFGLFYKTERIYAIDAQPTTLHRNNIGKGRPMYGLEIDGVHEHTWSSDGGGYAEPISLPLDQPAIIWKMFLKRAGIEVREFFHPDDNQPELDL